MVGERKVQSPFAVPYLGLPEKGSQPINDGIDIAHPSVAQEVANDPACGWFACGTLAYGLLHHGDLPSPPDITHSTMTSSASGADVMSRRPNAASGDDRPLARASAPRAAMPPPRRRASLRIFAFRCGLP